MSEDDLCKQITLWMSVVKPRCLFFHVPNGGKRGPVTAAKLKAMGVKAGVSDYVVVMPEGRCGFVECKVGRNKPSDAQKAFFAGLEALGHKHAVCRSLDEWIEILRGWGVGMRGAA